MTNLLLILLLLVGCEDTPTTESGDTNNDTDDHTHIMCRFISSTSSDESEECGGAITNYGCFNVDSVTECYELENSYNLDVYHEFSDCEYFCGAISYDSCHICECVDDECIELLEGTND